MGTLLHLRRIVPVDAPACGGAGCRQGDTPQACDCGIGALTEADLDRHIAERYGCPTTRTYPRSLAQAFPDVRASSVEVHRRPGLVERLINYVWSKA